MASIRKAASWGKSALLEASPSHLHGSLGSADSLSESCSEPCPDAHPPAAVLDETQQGSTVCGACLRGNSLQSGHWEVPPYLSSAHSTESLLIEMKGPSHHLSVTWKPELPAGFTMPPEDAYMCSR